MSNIFISTHTESGYSWSITTKLGDILNKAEERYGSREMSYTTLGVEITTEDHPSVWFPGTNKRIAIRITQECMNDMDRAVYQVAHEVIHCLAPIGEAGASVLEEGLATLFSTEYCLDNNHGEWHSQLQCYKDAMVLTRQLMLFDRDIIKKLRESQNIISLLTANDIVSVNPNVPMELAEELTKKFIRDV